MEGEQKELDTGLICLVLLARFHKIAVEPESIRHMLGGGSKHFTVEDILRAAKKLKLKTRLVSSKIEKLSKTPLPVIAQMEDESFVVIIKVIEDGVLIQNPQFSAPQKLSLEDFSKNWTGKLVLLVERGGIVAALKKFDISWFIPFIIRFRWLLAQVLFASFFLQLFALVTPIFFQITIDKVLVHQALSTLDVLVVGLAAVSIFEVILSGLRTYVFSHTTSRIDVLLSAHMYQHLLSLPIAYFQTRQTGQTVARVRELENIREFITGSALTLTIDLFFTFVFIAVMWLYSPQLTIIVLVSIVCYAALSISITGILRRRIEERFQKGATANTHLVESVQAIDSIKSMGVEPQMQRRWEDIQAEYVRANFRTVNFSNWVGQTAQFISKGVIVATLWWGARLVITGEITVGQLIAFNMLVGRVSGPILRLSQLWQDFQQARVSVERLGDILNSATELSASAGRTHLPRLKGDVVFRNICFRYHPNQSAVLEDISCEFKAGLVVGIAGPSGSGKSTFAKLIQRLYVPEAGQILIDGMDLVMVVPAQLRRQIGVVQQDAVLLNRSVRDNIALSDPAMDLEKVIEVAKLSGAHEFILQLQEGYDTILEERGMNLSGGQRQRIAIARALATDPRILILDEATSALDYESEAAIKKNMEEICKDRTVFIIAHRLSTLYSADTIIVLDKGRIIEQGAHQALLQQDGRYAGLWRLQQGGTNGE